jgi:serine protease inhibitor
MARPTDYNDSLLELSEQYLHNLPEDEVVHSIEGLADYINIARSTIYDWSSQEDKKRFSDIVENIREKQAKTLINKGLEGKFTPAITKVMLSKHGYSEKVEQELSNPDGNLKTIIINKSHGDSITE